jgi:hypothetical protein
VAEGWRRLHNEELRNLYASQNIIRVINSRRTTWAGHVARVGDMRNAHNVLVVKPERKRPFKVLGIDGRVILEWIFGK